MRWESFSYIIQPGVTLVVMLLNRTNASVLLCTALPCLAMAAEPTVNELPASVVEATRDTGADADSYTRDESHDREQGYDADP
jgi:iron complex outermembrane receptor protein